METFLRGVVPVLSAALMLLLYLRRRGQRHQSSSDRRGLVVRTVDSFEKAERAWALVLGLVIIAVVVVLAFFDPLVADILSVTVLVMAAIWLLASRRRHDGFPGGKGAVALACILNALCASAAHARYLPKKCVDETGTVIPDSVVDTEVFRELGNKVTLPRLAPEPVTVWPHPAAECRVPSGGVTVFFIVRKNGSTCGEMVLHRMPKGCKEFEDAILEGIRRLQFEPARVDGAALAVRWSVTLKYR